LSIDIFFEYYAENYRITGWTESLIKRKTVSGVRRMAYSGFNSEIADARAAYLQLRGYLRDDSETSALDGVFNSLKSPLRLRVDEQGASLDQRCESVEYMITSLHRVGDLLTTLQRLMAKRAHVDISEVDSAMATLRKSAGFVYFGHFTNLVKHTIYVRRGQEAGVLYFDAFRYKDRGRNIFEARRTVPEIVDYAREVVGLAANVMKSMSRAVAGSTDFDPSYSEVCATPSPEPIEDDEQP